MILFEYLRENKTLKFTYKIITYDTFNLYAVNLIDMATKLLRVVPVYQYVILFAYQQIANA